jgi:hypothetical protein
MTTKMNSQTIGCDVQSTHPSMNTESKDVLRPIRALYRAIQKCRKLVCVNRCMTPFQTLKTINRVLAATVV